MNHPLRIVQISDTHLLGHPGDQFRGVDTRQSLDRVLALIRQRFWPVDMVIATGDLAHDGSLASYRELFERFTGLGTPVYCLPGNHDNGRWLRGALNHGRVRTVGAVAVPDWLLVLLDSTLPGAAAGQLSQAELQRLSQLLEQHPDCHVLVFLHHHPVPVHSPWLDQMALENPGELFSRMDLHPNVRALLWGHVHQVYEGERKGVRLLGCPATSLQFLPRTPELQVDTLPPGFRWLRLFPGGQMETGLEWLDSI